MTGSVAAGHLPSAAVTTTLQAVGIQRAAWLLLAFPLAGAVILLLGGKRTNAWGHLLGVAMPVAAFCYAVAAFIAMLGYPANQRARDLTLFTWIDVGRFHVNIGILLDPLSICFVLLITGVGSLIHIFAVGYMAAGSGAPPVLRVHEPVPGRDAAARAGRQLPGPVRGLGGRRPGLLPAHRVLAVQARRRHRGQEGLHRQPGR